MNMVQTKICTRCKLEKDISEFPFNDSSRKRLKPSCRHCRTLYRRECANRYPWYKTQLYINRRCNNKNHISARNYSKKGIRNFLSLNDLKTMWFRDGASGMKRPSIDRIDPDLDYAFENCRYLELSENCSRAWNLKRKT